MFLRISCVTLNLQDDSEDSYWSDKVPDNNIEIECSIRDYESKLIQEYITFVPKNITVSRDISFTQEYHIPMVGEIKGVSDESYEYWLESKEINNEVFYSGLIGYHYDLGSIKFTIKDNIVNVIGNYRNLWTKDIWDNWEPKVDDESVPYIRFPRSKDGVTIPEALNQIFTGHNIHIIINTPE
jgi:hypothetical protein